MAPVRRGRPGRAHQVGRLGRSHRFLPSAGAPTATLAAYKAAKKLLFVNVTVYVLLKSPFWSRMSRLGQLKVEEELQLLLGAASPPPPVNSGLVHGE